MKVVSVLILLICIVTVSLYSKEVKLDKDGTIVIDGKRTFFYGAYRSPDKDYLKFDGLKQGSFNLSHDYRFEELLSFDDEKFKKRIFEAQAYLDLAEKAGVYIFMGIPRYIVGTSDLVSLNKWVNALKNKSALLIWYLIDEPSTMAKNEWVKTNLKKSMKKCYSFIKQLDPDHPVCIVGCRKTTVFDYKDTFDLIWADAYSAPRNVLDAYDFPVYYKKKSGKPAWFVAGASSAIFHNNRKLKLPERFHRPNPKEIRAQAHAAIAGGSQGLLYYWLPNHDIMKETPAIWQSLVDLGNELYVLNDVLTSTQKIPNVKITSRYQDRGTMGSSKWSRSKGLSFSKLLSWTRIYNDNLYVGIVNAGYDTMVKVNIKLPTGYSTNKIIQYPGNVVVAEKENEEWVYYWDILDVVIFEQSESDLTLLMNECDTVVFCFNKKLSS